MAYYLSNIIAYRISIHLSLICLKITQNGLLLSTYAQFPSPAHSVSTQQTLKHCSVPPACFIGTNPTHLSTLVTMKRHSSKYLSEQNLSFTTCDMLSAVVNTFYVQYFLALSVRSQVFLLIIAQAHRCL